MTAKDVFSKGFICPKGSAIGHLHHDPDRLRRPLVKRDGVHVAVSWDEAWREVARLFAEFDARHARAALATYHGNPTAHNLGAMVFGRPLAHALGNTARFTASTVDQLPRQVAAAMVFGSAALVPVPDLDRTDLLVVVGGNPMVSNGSLCTAPDFPGRIAALRARGGRLVVIDPCRTRTAEEADQWLAIRPGTDALALAAMVTALAQSGRVAIGDHLGGHVDGLDVALGALSRFTPDAVAATTGIAAADLRSLAAAIAAADRAVVYSRIGTTTTAFGTTTSWLVDLLNAVTGNLDRAGGAMFPLPAAGGPAAGPAGRGRGYQPSTRRTRVGGHAVVLGEYPAAALAGEILVPGDGQIRGLVTVAGNPVLSTPDGERLQAALADLELMISVDIYLNETTRFADVILPPPSVLSRDHYDLALLPFAVRNVAHLSEPVFAREADEPDEWEILARLALIAQGAGPDAPVDVVESLMVDALLRRAVDDPSSPVAGGDPGELASQLDPQVGPTRVLDVMLQLGPYGAAFGRRPDGLSVAALRAAPHGVDLGPLESRLPGALQTRSGKVELAPAALIADLDRLAELLDTPPADALLVGRRHLRSNNSWMHNLAVLVSGRPRCTLLVHPDDADRWRLHHGGVARVANAVGSVDVTVEVSDAIRPGVVSLPHGWGHGRPGASLAVAAEHAGVNANALSDPAMLDPLSSTSVLNAIPVTVSAVG